MAMDRLRRRRAARSLSRFRRRERSALHRRYHRASPGRKSHRARRRSLPHQFPVAPDRGSAPPVRAQIRRSGRIQLLSTRRSQGHRLPISSSRSPCAIPSACCASSTLPRAASAKQPSSRSNATLCRTASDLWAAIGRMLDESQFPTRAHAALDAFRRLIQELAEALPALPLHDAHAICRGAHRLSQDARAGKHHRVRRPHRKLGRAGKRRGRSRRAWRNGRGFPGSCRPGRRRRLRGRARPGQSAHAAQRQGSRVSLRISGRPGRRPVPPQPLL